MLSGLCTVPKNITVKTARHGIDTLIFIKHALKTSFQLASILQGLVVAVDDTNESNQTKNPLIEVFLANLMDESFQTILESIDGMFTESTSFSKVTSSLFSFSFLLSTN